MRTCSYLQNAPGCRGIKEVPTRAAVTCLLGCRYGTNVLSAAATPDLSYVVGGCMDACVHIWHFSSSPEAAAAASAAGSSENPAGSGGDAGSAQIVEFSCGGYMAKVTAAVFNAAGSMLSTLGGTQCTVWDFTGPDGPAGTIPVVGLGHTKAATCQVRGVGVERRIRNQLCHAGGMMLHRAGLLLQQI